MACIYVWAYNFSVVISILVNQMKSVVKHFFIRALI